MGAFIFSFILAVVITPAVIWWYKKNNWIDDPETNAHKKTTHLQAVPRGGGIVIFISILIAAAVWLQLDQYLLGILLGGLLLTLVGWLDDIYNLHPGLRLVVGILAGLLVVGSGIGIAYISNPFGNGVIHLDQPQWQFSFFNQSFTLWVLADIFALLFILWNMNIVNWSKGVDGQLPGFVSISAIIIGLLSTRFMDDPTQFHTATLAFIVAGAFAGLLLWNFYPQKIMPGYGAGSLAGYFLAILAILSGAKVATTLMVLAIPTADALFTIARRLRAGKSPVWGDRGHLHHKLMDVLGWGRRRIAIFYWLTSFALGSMSLYLNTTQKMITIGITALLVFGFLIWAKYQPLKHG